MKGDVLFDGRNREQAAQATRVGGEARQTESRYCANPGALSDETRVPALHALSLGFTSRHERRVPGGGLSFTLFHGSR